MDSRIDGYYGEGPVADADGSARAPSDAPRPGDTVWVRSPGNALIVLGVAAGDRLVLATATPPHMLHLTSDDDGTPGLMTIQAFASMEARGQAGICPPAVPAQRDAAGGLTTAIEMLDVNGVPNGAKAIAIFLHRHWTEDLIRRFGPHENPNTIRRWRAKSRAPPP